jgi:hypothetical protein
MVRRLLEDSVLDFLKRFSVTLVATFSFISSLLLLYAGFVTHTNSYFFLAGLSILVAPFYLSWKVLQDNRKLRNENTQLKNPDVDFLVVKRDEPYLSGIQFFDHITSDCKFEFIIPCELTNKTHHPITIGTSVTVKSDLPLKNQTFKMRFSHNDNNRLTLKDGFSEFVPMRMWIEFEITPFENFLPKIANASYIKVEVIYSQYDDKFYRAEYEIKHPQKFLIDDFEKRFAEMYGTDVHRRVDVNLALTCLKYLWKALP